MLRLLFLFSFIAVALHSQTPLIKGKITNATNNEPIPFANVLIQSTTTGAQTDADGNYEIKNIAPGLYNIEVSYIGFKPKVVYEVQVTNFKPSEVNIVLEEEENQLQEVQVVASPFNKTLESPVSLRTIGVSEIERNPGGNRDISKVIQSLPGVASTVSFRNDIIIRGGAPNENRFYLDGVEVPNINHFATQGSSGGPVGMINVNFIREVDFYSGAFPANRGNTLSSLFEFKQKDGNADRLVFTSTIGASDFGITLDGPIGKKTTYIFSARRSYLQFLFQALQLPFLPTYNDFQFKIKNRPSDKEEITIIGLGAIDQFDLNLNANETELQKYILGYLPDNSQWNYTLGATYKRFREKGSTLFVISRNHLNNHSIKYYNNNYSSDTNKILDYESQEIENKIRMENTYRNKGYKINYGFGYEYVEYSNATFNKLSLPVGVKEINFKSALNFNKYNLFIQAGKDYFNKKLALSVGIRADGADYSQQTINPLTQVSPRFSLAYSITEKLSFNFNTGIYYQLPAYTVLGYRDSSGTPVNKKNNIKYISCQHMVSGLEYNGSNNFKITVESFYKNYTNSPFLLNDSISLANLGADFGVIGNAPAVSTSQGRSYGMELMIQQKLFKGFYGIVAYTLVRSEFTDKYEKLISSAWDNRHIITLTAGKKFKKNWELGAKWRFLGGAPYTPLDVSRSSLKAVWDITGTGLPNYDLLNTRRLNNVHQLDVRLDKKYYFSKWSLNVYVDVQNLYNFQAQLPPYLNVKKDNAGNPITDAGDPLKYQVYFIENTLGNVLPTIGLIVEF